MRATPGAYLAVLLLTGALGAGCATPSPSRHDPALRAGTRVHVVAAPEIASAVDRGARSLADLLRMETRVRLRRVGTTDRVVGRPHPTAASPLLVVDRAPVGDFGVIHMIPAADVREIRVLAAAEAAGLYGSRGSWGAVVVFTRRGVDRAPR